MSSLIDRLKLLLSFLKSFSSSIKNFFMSTIEEKPTYTYILLITSTSDIGGKDIVMVAKRYSKQESIEIPRVHPFPKKISFVKSDNKKRLASVNVAIDDLAEALHVLKELGFVVEPADTIIEVEEIGNG